MTEKEKMLAGLLFSAQDAELDADQEKCQAALFEFNSSAAHPWLDKNEKLKAIFGETDGAPTIMSPFHCDYGYNIFIGKSFFANYGLTILDSGRVTIGDNVMIGPDCGIYTPNHPLQGKDRRHGEEIALPVCIGNDVWIGGHVIILPGVTIGNNVVIGAGSVVSKDIPDSSVAVGNPCRVIKKIEG